jgi:MraZ protein
MSADGNSGRICYNSVFRHGLDEKRRVQIPAMWRTDEAGAEFTLLVWPQSAHGPCLRALPPKKMAELMADIDALPKGDPKKQTLKRFIGSSSTQVVVDKGGRICLPEEMAKAAGITDEVVLVGLLDRFEIWNPERFAAVQAADAALAPEAFKMMD